VIAVVGLSHRTAPIALRERIAFDAPRTIELLSHARNYQTVVEVMLLSTCNRTELVAAGNAQTPVDLLTKELREIIVGRVPETDGHLYLHGGSAAVQHIFRVVSSLDSLVVGEPQILGQFKEAFDLACRQGTIGNHLHRVVSRALRTAKRVRHETQVGSGQVSVPTVALDLARQIFGEMAGHTVVLLGTGEMGELVARLLQQSGARLVIVGRNVQRVSELQDRYRAEGRSFDTLEASLSEADVVVTSTSAPNAIVDRVLVKRVMRKRRGRDLFFVDVAVPRDINPDVDSLDGVYRYDVDDLAAVVARSLGSREKEAERAERIVNEEVARFERWVEAEQVTPFVRALRQHFLGTLHRELRKSLRGRLKHLGDSERLHLERMIDAAINKLMHEPTMQLRKWASQNSEELDQATAVLDDLFGLTKASQETSPDSGDELDPGETSSPESVTKENIG
jgi:glutamyl-tRNA reductase